MTKTYTFPPASLADLARLQDQAKRRRQALTAAGCSTYALGHRARADAIMCLCCGLGSNNRGDIEHRYCGFCHEFHSEWREE